MGWISSIVRSEILLIPTSRFLWIVFFYMDLMLLYLSNIKLFYEKSHENVRSFQQHNATIDPSILGVSCMQPQLPKRRWLLKKMRIVLFDWRISRIFVIWDEKNRASKSSWTRGHQVCAPFLDVPKMFEKEIPALETMIFRFHSSNSGVIAKTSRDRSPGGLQTWNWRLCHLNTIYYDYTS